MRRDVFSFFMGCLVLFCVWDRQVFKVLQRTERAWPEGLDKQSERTHSFRTTPRIFHPSGEDGLRSDICPMYFKLLDGPFQTDLRPENFRLEFHFAKFDDRNYFLARVHFLDSISKLKTLHAEHVPLALELRKPLITSSWRSLRRQCGRVKNLNVRKTVRF